MEQLLSKSYVRRFQVATFVAVISRRGLNVLCPSSEAAFVVDHFTAKKQLERLVWL